jgi:hypothetical protein
MLRRLICAILRHDHTPSIFVRMAYDDGSFGLVGPMDRFAADLFVVHRLAPSPFWEGKRVLSARLIGRENG